MNRKLGDGLFLQCCEEVAELYPKIKFETMIIDNCCMQVSSQRESREWKSLFLLELFFIFIILPLAGAESLPV